MKFLIPSRTATGMVPILAMGRATFTPMPFGTTGLHSSIFRKVCRGGFSINQETRAMKTDSEKTLREKGKPSWRHFLLLQLNPTNWKVITGKTALWVILENCMPLLGND